MARELGDVSRPQIARRLGLSLPTVTNLVQQLLEDGILTESGFSQSQGGRRARLLRLNSAHIRAVGVECSLLGTEAVLVDLSGKVLARHSLAAPATRDPEAAMNAIYGLVDQVLAQTGQDKPNGIGVGVSGFVNRAEGISVQFPRAENWSNVPVASLLSRRYRLKTFVVNDVQAATLGELRYGIGQGCRDFLYLHIGRGIRLGIVVGGELYYGSSGKAGELGHMVVVEDGPICYCGNYGCLESLAGPPAIVNQALDAISKGVESTILNHVTGGVSGVDFGMVLSAATGGDRLATNLLAKAGQYIGRAVANLSNVLDPELVIVGGNPGQLGQPLVEVINQTFRSVAMPPVRDRVQIRMSQFESRPCSLGAGTLVFESFFQHGLRHLEPNQG